MSRTLIELDGALMTEAAQVLGARSRKDTTETALREVLTYRRRTSALARLRAAVAEGAFDPTLLR